MADKVMSKAGIGLLGTAAVAVVLPSMIYTVDGGERAVMFNRISGISETLSGEGTHFKIPGIQYPYMYDIRTRPRVIQTTTGTKDLQTVTIHCRLLYKPNVERLPHIHTTLGQDYDERVIPSIGHEVLKAIIAQYNAEQLLTQRERVSSEIQNQIIERAKVFNILLDDVSITHLNYGKEFAKAIEEKQVAEQEAERQKFIVQLAEQERQATVIRSEGEAEAAQIISEALKSQGTGYVEFRKTAAAKEIAESLAKSNNVVYMPAQQNVLMSMPGMR